VKRLTALLASIAIAFYFQTPNASALVSPTVPAGDLFTGSTQRYPTGSPLPGLCPIRSDGSYLSSTTNPYGNSSYIGISSSAQCLAGTLFLTRGYLTKYFLDSRIRIPGALYDQARGGAEAIAQSRAIQYINDEGITAIGDVTGGTVTVPRTSRLPGVPLINSDLQWETWVGPSQRSDLIIYDAAAANSLSKPMLVVEIKGTWNPTMARVQAQVQGYVETLNDKVDATAEIGKFGYSDLFFITRRCRNGTVAPWRYDVSMGVGVMVVQETRNCSDGTTHAEAISSEEAAAEAAEEDATSYDFPVPGRDDDQDGIDDYTLATHAVPWLAPSPERANMPLPTAPVPPINPVPSTAQRMTIGEGPLRQFFKVAADSLSWTSICSKNPGYYLGKAWDAFLGGPAKALALTPTLAGPLTPGAAASGSQIVNAGVAEAETIAIQGEAIAEAGAGATVVVWAVAAAAVFGALYSLCHVGYQFNQAFGDPHMVTLDGRAYDLQSAGEFVTMDAASLGLEVQARLRPILPGQFSLVDRVVIGVAGHKVEIQPGGDVWIDGSPLTYTTDYGEVSPGIYAIRNESEVTLVQPDSFRATIRPNSIGIDLPVGVATLGLLGNHDGDPSNDLAAADGTLVPAGDTAALHSWFADSWRVTDTTSLFTYGAGQSTASYTDKSFPSNVTTLADFSPSQLETANGKCIAAGVKPGVPMEACVLDLLVTADDSFQAAAAAIPRGAIDPTSATFDATGVLRQSFDGSVGQNMAGTSYVQVSASTRAVGPFFSDSPYSFALMSVPRHDGANLTSRVLVLGDSVPNPVNPTVVVTADTTSAEVSLADGGAVISGPPGAAIVGDGSGTTQSGMPYRAYMVTLPVTHFGDSMKVTYAPKHIDSINGIGLAVDDIQVALQTNDAQVKASLVLPFTAGSEQGSGFGQLETPGAADEYQFTLAGASTDVLAEMGSSGPVRIDLVNLASGQIVDPTDRTSFHFVWRALPAGDYSVRVTGKGQASDYSFPVMVVPAAQEFAYQIGQSIGDGSIAGVATSGAGRLETTASMDIYRFTVPVAQDGETVVFQSGGILPVCRSARLMSGHDGGYSLGSPCTSTGFWFEAPLPAGEYRVEVPVDSLMLAGAYLMSSYVKQAPQVFSYTLGDVISNGMLGATPTPGAGNLETVSSVDVYQFTVTTASTWVFPEQAVVTNCRNASLYTAFSGGTSMGSVCMPGTLKQYDLSPGDYRIEVPTFNSTTGPYSISPYLKPAPQVFAYALGQSVSNGMVAGTAAVGAGNLETAASTDVYTFTVTEAQAGQWTVRGAGDGLYNVCSGAQLYPGLSGGTSLGSVCSSDGLTTTLATGDYRIEVPANGYTGTYTLGSAQRQVFPFVLGQSVSNGVVAGVPTLGAGNLESAASIDVYSFTVSPAQASQTWVFDGPGPFFPICGSAQLVPVAGGASLGSICGHLEVQFAAGDYRIEVPVGFWGPGTYSFSSYAKPAPQQFSYQLGQTVAVDSIGGVAAPGAGNLETSTSVDIYRFTVTAAQAGSWAFDGVNNGIWPRCSDSKLLPGTTGGTSLGSICSHLQVTLNAGDYRIEIPVGGNGVGAYSFVSTQMFITGSTPTISGTAQVDQTLTAVPGGWTPATVGLSYQWLRNGGPITGATGSTYGLVLADLGQQVQVMVSGTVSGLTSVQKTSAAVVPVATPPQVFSYQLGQTVATGSIGGVAAPGAGNLETSTSVDIYRFTVTAGQAGSWAFDGVNNGIYPRCGDSKLLPGATGGTSLGSICSHLQVTLNAGDYRVEVPVGGNGPGAYSFTSTQMFITGSTPTISGTAQVGQTLTAVPGSWTPAAVGLSYQWLRNAAPITGATGGTYGLMPADLGQQIQVTVTGTASGMTSVQKTSGAVVPIAAVAVSGSLVPVAPARLLDTRSGVGASGPVAAWGTVSLQVTGRGGVPASGVAAVVLNITVADTQIAGFITAYPSGTGLPAVSNINYVAGQVVPNAAVVKLGSDGKVNLTNSSAGTVQLTADVAGYYLAGNPTAAGTLSILNPFRLLDTRTGTGAAGPVGAGGTVTMQVAGVGGLPATGMSAVVLNVTVTSTAAAGFITVYASGTTMPQASNLNFVAGQTVSNLVMVKVGADGKITLYNGSAGTVQLLADISAYTLAGTPVVPGALAITDPTRLLDSRTGNGASGPVPAFGVVSLQISGRGGLPATGIAAVVVNLTVTSPQGNGYITAYPSGTSLPGVSNLNFVTGQTVPNLVVVKVGSDGKINLYNGSAGTVQLIADIAGYYLA
jgi:hypothetical protein